MHALHDQDLGSRLGVVQAGRHDLVPPVAGTFSHSVGLGLLDVMRIVTHDAVSPFAGVGPSDRASDAAAAAVGLKAVLFVLVAGEAEAISEAAWKPGRLDQAPAPQRVPNAETLGIGSEQPAPLGPA